MEIIFVTLLTSLGVFLIAGVIIQSIENFFNVKERFVDEDLLVKHYCLFSYIYIQWFVCLVAYKIPMY